MSRRSSTLTALASVCSVTGTLTACTLSGPKIERQPVSIKASSELYNLESVVSDQRRKVHPFFFCHRVLAVQLHDSPRAQSGLLQRRLPLYPFAFFLFCLKLAFRHNLTKLVQVPAPIACGALKRKQTLSAHPAV